MTIAQAKSTISELDAVALAFANKGKTPVATVTSAADVATAKAADAKAERLRVQALLEAFTGTTAPPPNTNTPSIPTTEPIAQEGGTFTLTEPKTVKFISPTSGQGYQKLLGAGTFLCGKEFFGDPIFGEQKWCYIKLDSEPASAISPILDTTQIDGTPSGPTGGTSTGGGGGGGGTVTTPTTNRLAKIKAAFAAVPAATVAALSRTTQGSLIYTNGPTNGSPSLMPGLPGGEQGARHYFARANGNTGNIGAADLNTITWGEGKGVWEPAVNALANFQPVDGTSTQFWKSRSLGGLMIGMEHTGRAMAFANRIEAYGAHLFVDGKLAPLMRWGNQDSYLYVDFQTTAKRKLVFVADGEFAEIAYKSSDIVTPYNWLTDHGTLKYSYLGDSWGQTGDRDNTGLSMPQLQGALLACEYVGGSTIGGTGYSATSDNGTNKNGTDATRQALFSHNSPDILDIALIVNDHPDNHPTFAQDVATVQNAARQANPESLLVVTMWCSQGSRATNLTGSEARKRDIILAEIRKKQGPWIAIDGFAGMWYTSAGTQKPSASGPFITGEGSVAQPIQDGGNANTWIDEPGGRHPTSAGVRGLCEIKAAFIRAAVATM